MLSDQQKATEKARLQEEFEQMWEKLWQWRAAHPEASIDEIVRQVTPWRRNLMGQVVVQLAAQHGSGVAVEGVRCAECGAELTYKGEAPRGVIHLEGEAELSRAYYYCASCKAGIFPPGPAVGLGQSQLDTGDNPGGAEFGSGDWLVSAGSREI